MHACMYVNMFYVCTDRLYMYTCRPSLLRGLPTKSGTQSGTQARLPWEICSLCTWLQLASQVCIHVCMHACIYLCCGCHYRFVCVNTYTNTYMHTQKSSPTTLLRAFSCPSRSTSPRKPPFHTSPSCSALWRELRARLSPLWAISAM